MLVRFAKFRRKPQQKNANSNLIYACTSIRDVLIVALFKPQLLTSTTLTLSSTLLSNQYR